jgi:hypothetical protein
VPAHDKSDGAGFVAPRHKQIFWISAIAILPEIDAHNFSLNRPHQSQLKPDFSIRAFAGPALSSEDYANALLRFFPPNSPVSMCRKSGKQLNDFAAVQTFFAPGALKRGSKPAAHKPQHSVRSLESSG